MIVTVATTPTTAAGINDIDLLVTRAPMLGGFRRYRLSSQTTSRIFQHKWTEPYHGTVQKEDSTREAKNEKNDKILA